MLTVIMLSVIMRSVVMRSVIMLNVVMLSAVAPSRAMLKSFASARGLKKKCENGYMEQDYTLFHGRES